MDMSKQKRVIIGTAVMVKISPIDIGKAR